MFGAAGYVSWQTIATQSHRIGGSSPLATPPTAPAAPAFALPAIAATTATSTAAAAAAPAATSIALGGGRSRLFVVTAVFALAVVLVFAVVVGSGLFGPIRVIGVAGKARVVRELVVRTRLHFAFTFAFALASVVALAFAAVADRIAIVIAAIR